MKLRTTTHMKRLAIKKFTVMTLTKMAQSIIKLSIMTFIIITN
jgi:hypothetical protein